MFKQVKNRLFHNINGKNFRPAHWGIFGCPLATAAKPE